MRFECTSFLWYYVHVNSMMVSLFAMVNQQGARKKNKRQGQFSSLLRQQLFQVTSQKDCLVRICVPSAGGDSHADGTDRAGFAASLIYCCLTVSNAVTSASS